MFAHYDTRQRVAPHVIHYLRQLRICGFETHVALSGMDRLSDADRTSLDRVGAVAHFRHNHGHDFGAWQDLLARGCANDADTILLANDSVFGPLQPLAPIFDSMRSRDVDVWGMIESREAGWHLQSWFLCFSAAGLASPAVARVLRQPFGEMSKPEIVLHGELGLGAAIRADSLRWDTRWHQPGSRLRRLIPGNAMHVDFLSVLRSGRVPFIKIELLRDNPTGVPWLGEWRRAVRGNPMLPLAWIDDHLAGSVRAPPPQPRASLRMRLVYAAISRDQPEAARSLLRRWHPN